MDNSYCTFRTTWWWVAGRETTEWRSPIESNWLTDETDSKGFIMTNKDQLGVRTENLISHFPSSEAMTIIPPCSTQEVRLISLLFSWKQNNREDGDSRAGSGSVGVLLSESEKAVVCAGPLTPAGLICSGCYAVQCYDLRIVSLFALRVQWWQIEF